MHKPMAEIIEIIKHFIAINANIDTSLGLKPRSSKHTKTVSEQDREIVSGILHDLKPFKFTYTFYQIFAQHGMIIK
jgi:hypothetical protein